MWVGGTMAATAVVLFSFSLQNFHVTTSFTLLSLSLSLSFPGYFPFKVEYNWNGVLFCGLLAVKHY